MNGLQFFVHNDPDAVRVELAGSLREADVEAVRLAWERAALTDALKPAIIDITFIADADEYGRALLGAMHRFGVRIIADSPESSAIAQPIVTGPIETDGSKPGWLHRLIMFLLEERAADAALPAEAEIVKPLRQAVGTRVLDTRDLAPSACWKTPCDRRKRRLQDAYVDIQFPRSSGHTRFPLVLTRA